MINFQVFLCTDQDNKFFGAIPDRNEKLGNKIQKLKSLIGFINGSQYTEVWEPWFLSL